MKIDQFLVENPSITLNIIEKLALEAREAAKMAYAPYSKYMVGCSALTNDDSNIISGCNIENASYPLSLCAERSAISNAIMKGYSLFKMMAVHAINDDNCIPCGACRQVLIEFTTDSVSDIWIISVPSTISIPIQDWNIFSLRNDLLPNSFGGKNLLIFNS